MHRSVRLRCVASEVGMSTRTALLNGDIFTVNLVAVCGAQGGALSPWGKRGESPHNG